MFINIINDEVSINELANSLNLPVSYLRNEYDISKGNEFISLDMATSIVSDEGNIKVYRYLTENGKEDTDIISKIDTLIKDVRLELPDCKSKDIAIEKMIQVKEHVKDARHENCEFSYGTLSMHRCPHCKNSILVELFFNRLNKNYRYVCPSCHTNVVVVIGDSKDE